MLKPMPCGACFSRPGEAHDHGAVAEGIGWLVVGSHFSEPIGGAMGIVRPCTSMDDRAVGDCVERDSVAVHLDKPILRTHRIGGLSTGIDQRVVCDCAWLKTV